MKTIWGERIDKTSVLSEYPRPQMRRGSYINLNGEWEYAITKDMDAPTNYDGNILVPFSPESEISGVMRTLMPNETLWYRKNLVIAKDFFKGRVLIHFGAVDQEAAVYVNESLVCTHVGGYTPFAADITDTIHVDDENIITVRVKDTTDTSYHSRGKQKMKRGGIWYTPQSGIWQTVWLESVPENYIKSVEITPDFDNARLVVAIESDGEFECEAKCEFGTIKFMPNTKAQIDVNGFEAWSPESPKLYDIEFTMGADRVQSYFGMRKFSVCADENGTKRLFLNGKPYFHNGLLDQGYWIDGLYTAPSDEAMINDIKTMKKLGFNMLRKHIKVEPLRWYYHCDRLGMLVWQDMVNGGGDYSKLTVTMPLVTGKHISDHNYSRFGRENADGRAQYYRELDEMIHHLKNCVSIAMWVPFNEGWGQFDAAEAVNRIRAIDDTRTIDHASGWHDQKIGDIQSLHVYFKKYKHKPDKLGRAVVLSEFGGYNRRVDGHCFNEKDYGYKRFTSEAELTSAYHDLYMNEIIPAKKAGLCACVYTQLSDVEDELNGILTYDRRVVKFAEKDIIEINRLLEQ